MRFGQSSLWISSRTILLNFKLKSNVIPVIFKSATICTSCVVLRKNYYNILQVSKYAKQNEIKNAYYKLSMIYHPDQSKDDAVAAEVFKEIAEAYEVLGDIHKRKRYDKGRQYSAGFVTENIDTSGLTRKKKDWHRDGMHAKADTNSSSSNVHYYDHITNENRKSAFERRRQLQRNYKHFQNHEEEIAHGSQGLIFFCGGIFIFAAMVYFSSRSSTKSKKE